MKHLIIRGAREHNLQGIDIDLPRDKLVVITGPSGSGKSSLAFDTIYAEGQRRYVESLSPYARQFLDRLARPEVDTIEGLSPAIAIEQKSIGRNPRSTVGTVTEIQDYLRLLYARVGRSFCHRCHRSVARQTVQEMVAEVYTLPAGSRMSVMAPVWRGKAGDCGELIESLRRDGFTRVELDGELKDLGESLVIDPEKPHDLSVYVDRLVLKDEGRSRLAESIELALSLAQGIVRIALLEPGGGGHDLLFSELPACHHCKLTLPHVTPQLFSFNSPQGACGRCSGLGVLLEFDESLIVPDASLSLREGAVHPFDQRNAAFHQRQFEQLAEAFGFSLATPYGQLDAAVREMLMRGSGTQEVEFFIERGQSGRTYRRPFPGVIPTLERRLQERERKRQEAAADGDDEVDELSRYLLRRPCPECGGSRLRPEALAVRVGQLSIAEVSALSVRKAGEFVAGLQLEGAEQEIAERILRELASRLAFLEGVGVGYLSVDRAASTLSGGEGQRVRLATQIGAALVGVLYILDEPSIGLHARDTERLLSTLGRLRDLGNTVLVVEHDLDTIRAADHVVDLGPGAGSAGGRVVAEGSVEQICADPASITGPFLSGARTIELPRRRRGSSRQRLTLRGATHNNLKGIDVVIPLRRLVCITGVSGSGKSSLVVDTLLPALRRELFNARELPGTHHSIEGIRALDKVIAIDQSAIGRSPRSNPATYCGLFTHIRELYAQVPEARVRGYRAGRFSFNVKGGRCEACKGDGQLRIEMHFLPDVFVGCEVCGGLRYNEETLKIQYRGKSIADVLAMSVHEAEAFFHAVPRLREKLQTLARVGLGYLELGQAANTLSGGEAQRIKLARELSKRATGSTLYVLDEPTTGLHLSDIDHLLRVLDELVEAGNSVLVIEHNIEVIKCADHVIDLGPEGGEHGGQLVAAGTPEEIAREPRSHTGRFLALAMGER